MAVSARLGVALLTLLVCLLEVSAQSHQWKNRYSSCSKECGSGVQFLQKNCFTTDPVPQPAHESYCSSIPITEEEVMTCNTFPCGSCERAFTGQSGVLTSPYYPDKYTIPRYCRLSVTVPAPGRALLGFVSFQLEGLTLRAFAQLRPEDVCLCGTLVQLTDEAANGRVESFCGNKQPFSWVAESNAILLEFLTDSSHLFNRFEAIYSTIVDKPDCYEFIDVSARPRGNVVSPGFPNKYANGLHCEFVLHADPDQSIVLTILEFELEPSPDCDLDYLAIEDLYSRRRHVFCGTLPSSSWSSDANVVSLTFHSNANDVYRGFAILYEAAERAPRGSQFFTDSEGVITSPGFPLAYPADARAHYRIFARPDRLIVVTFTDFHTERLDSQAQPVPLPRVRRSTLDPLQYDQGLDCRQADYVEIEDFLEGSVMTYCGRLPPFTWFSKTNEVVIRFSSDADGNYRGFRATYRTVKKRLAPEWELVFRAASRTEREVSQKWLDLTRGYQEYNPAAKSLLADSPLTFKSREVNAWAEQGIQKVKIELYKAGSVVAAFQFRSLPGAAGSISNWFDCSQLIYSTYADLLSIDCASLRFTLFPGDFELTDEEGAAGATCTAPTARVWLDVQDRLPTAVFPTACMYEQAASRVAKFFYSSAEEGGLTSSGSNIAVADVFTIWIQRDCERTFVNIRLGASQTFSSPEFGRDYHSNLECDYYFLNGPFDSLLLHFQEFALEYDETCSKDYVEVEDFMTGRKDQFCGSHRDPLFSTDGNAAIVRFRTDSHGNFPGWTAEATAVGRNTEDCSAILSSPPGNLTNADHPSALTQFRLQGCETVLHVPAKDRVTASFSKVIVDLHDCPELTIIDPVAPTPIIEVSGEVLPFSWTSTSNELSLWYCASLPYRSYIFYEGNYRATISPDPPNAEFPGSFNWPTASVATGVQNCFIVLRTHPVLNLRILLTLDNLVLGDSDCVSYVQITDTTTQRSEKSCESTKREYVWTSDANEVIVQFYTSTFTSHAVEGRYTSQPRPKLEDSHILTGPTGTFTSPNYPELYPSGARVEYIVHGRAHEVVLLNFLELDLELASTTPVAGRRRRRRSPPAGRTDVLYRRQAVSQTQTTCEYDYVEIKDSLDPTRNVRYCGSQLPFTWVSSGNEATVSFVTDGSVEKKGFSAEYIIRPRSQPSGCGGTFETETGGFASPRYPRDYPPASECVYILLARAEKRIQLTFTSFNTEQDAECQKDSVEVVDRLTQRMDRYCGNQATPFSWTSDSNLVFVTFRSDAQVQYGGFVASYAWEDRQDKTVCQYNYQEANGEIQSPRSPGLYPNLKECTYAITVDSGHSIQLTFVQFALEDPDDSGKCEYDYLQIFDSAAGTSDKLCGSKDPFEKLIHTNKVKMVFKSDYIAFFKGFIVMYEQVDLSKPKPGGECDKSFTGSSGTFTSPNYPANYPLNKECRYSIGVTSGLAVKVTFTEFNLEGGGAACAFDYVELADEGTGKSDKYCGSVTGGLAWLSDTHRVTVTFVSDSVTTLKGFRAQYQTEAVPTQPAVVTGCGSQFDINLRQPTGKLTSPGYPNDYPLSTSCKVRITLGPGFVCRLTFTEFDLETEPKCGYDYLQLNSIPDDDAVVYCGSMAVPFTWTSKTNVCELHFESDVYVPAGGYRLEYEAVDAGSAAQKPASACRQTLTGTAGRFTSPNFPADYELETDCTTTVTVPAGYRVRIVFDTFEVEFKADCSWDWVQITDLGTGVETEKLCGTEVGLEYLSVTETVEVRLFSDAYEARQGYSARYSIDS